jgi:hypothetical protein
MSIGKLKALMDDVIFSFKFANTHLNMGMPSLFRQHSVRHGADIDLIRQTDVDASRLSQFRRSITNNSTDPGKQTGTDDYKQMVDIIIKRGGLLEHYAGPRDASDWLKFGELSNVRSTLRDEGVLKAGQDVWANEGFQAARSVAKTAYAAAKTEIEASLGQEIPNAVKDAVLAEIVEKINVNIEANGQKISLEEVEEYIDEVKT